MMENDLNPFQIVSKFWDDQFKNFPREEQLKDLPLENKEKLNYCCSSRAVVDHLISIGIAREKLRNVLNADYFNIKGGLSKHDEWYHSEHEVEADKLDECRMRFRQLQDGLWEVVSVLEQDMDDE